MSDLNSNDRWIGLCGAFIVLFVWSSQYHHDNLFVCDQYHSVMQCEANGNSEPRTDAARASRRKMTAIRRTQLCSIVFAPSANR